MQSSSVNKVIRDVDFCKCMHDVAGCRVTSSVRRLGSLVIGGFLTLTVHLCKCIGKYSEAFILQPLCEGFGQVQDSITGITTCCGSAWGIAFTTHPCLVLRIKKV